LQQPRHGTGQVGADTVGPLHAAKERQTSDDWVVLPMSSDVPVFTNLTALAVSTAQKFATRQRGSHRAKAEYDIPSGSIRPETFTAHLFTRWTDTLILNLSLLLLRQRLGCGGLVALLAERLGRVRPSNVRFAQSLVTSISKRVFGANYAASVISAVDRGILLTKIKRYMCLNWSDFEPCASEELKRAISAQAPHSPIRLLQVML
jgi:hypothetical protein